MKAFILIAHGSRRRESNAEVVELTNQLHTQLKGRFSFIESAFLELTEPSLPITAHKVIAGGATDITLYPYFLNSGVHVERDIPEILNDLRVRNPACTFTLLDHFGNSPDIVGIIMKTLN